VPEALAVRGDAGTGLEPRAGGGGQQRQHGMSGRRRQLACGANAPTKSPPRASKRSAARAYRTAERSSSRRDPRVVGRRDVAPVRLRPDLAQEGEEALGDTAGLELVAQDRVSARA